MKRATTLAPAKVNLFLRVLERRDDGFHELETLFQTISLADRVRVSLGADGTSVDPAVTIRVTGADVGPDEDNLAVRAAAAFRSRFDVAVPIRIDLEKVIPAGAGLGGGSSDAAAVLRCLSALVGKGTPVELAELALDLGSDVPFFLTPTGRALARGRGERLVPLPPLASRPLVVAMPSVHVSTAEAYGAIAEARAGSAPPVARAIAVEDLSSWSDVDGWVENDFEAPVAAAHPEVKTGLETLRVAVAGPVLLSGSGGASFGFASDEDEADEVARRLSAGPGMSAFAARTLGAAPAIDATEAAPYREG